MDANIKTPQDALEWLDRSIREEAELDGEMSNAHAIQLGFIQNMLAKFPRRNCDVGTVGQQDERFYAFCKRHFNEVGLCDKSCPCRDFNMIGGACSIVWAQIPYEEGGDK